MGLGYNTFGVANIGITHITGSNLITMIKRRLAYRKTFFEKRKQERKYLIYNPTLWRDKINILKFCFFTLTFVEPFYQSARGFLKKRDNAWFLHPLMCYIFFLGYAKHELTKRFN